MLPHIVSTLLLTASVHVVQAVNIYLYPARDYVAGINSLEAASAAVSRHFGLERFERLDDVSNVFTMAEDFVGMGYNDGLLLTMSEDDANAVLSSDFKAASTMERIPDPKVVDSLTPVVSTYLHRARQVYTSIFSPEEAWRLNDVDALSAFFDSADSSAFAALEVSRLHDLRHKYGSSSYEYQSFASSLRQFLEDAVRERPNFSIAVLTFRSALAQRREPEPQQSPFPSHPLPQEPISSISCFTDLETCSNSTSACSGRGQCVRASKAGRTCFVCACGVTSTGEGRKIKTEKWVGESCERKDISGPFVLLTGTVVVLILVVAGSISLLYSIGDQSLPSILLATAINSKRD